jgi:Kef-type K+ transport system membrane component KefB
MHVGPVAPVEAHQLLVFLLQVSLLLLFAVLLGRLATRFGMPSVVGELCAGVLLGPSILPHVTPAVSGWLFPHDPAQFHLLDAFGQIGVLLLVGLTGAEVDLRLIRRRSADAARISLAGIVVPFGLGIGLAFLLPGSLLGHGADRVTFALFLGVAMGVSAIPVIAKTLHDMRLLHRNVGQLTLCAVMIDDIIGWILLSVVAAMATTGVHGGDVLLTIGYVVGIVLCAVAVRPLIRRLVQAVTRSADAGVLIAMVVVLLLLGASLTQGLKLEAVFGAFICGLMISGSAATEQRRLVPLRTVVISVLAPVFFATAGLRMDLTALAEPAVLLAGLVVLTVAVAGKFIGAYAGARLSRLTHWEGLALGSAMNARGVIEVIIAMVGLRLGVLTPAMYTIIVLVAIATSLMAPPLLRRTMARVEHTAEERLREDGYRPEPSSVS